MSQSLVKNLIHLIYSTKDRKPFIHADVRKALYAYQAGIFRKWDSPALIIGGVADHIHALFTLSKNYALKTIVEEIKKGSSKWMKSAPANARDFFWQGGYAAFSVSPSNTGDVFYYIEHQEEHHRTMSYQDELRAFLARHHVEFDERYVWD